MRIAFATPEVLPFSKTGGLADVARALPAALGSLGCDVTVFSPCYRQASAWVAAHAVAAEHIELPGQLRIGREQHALRYQVMPGNPQHVLVQSDYYFQRAHPYLDTEGLDYADNTARFAFFCRAVLEYCQHHGIAPDVVHCHDWQTALLPVYLRTLYGDGPLSGARSLLTLHNLGYPGIFPAEQLEVTGLSHDVFTIDGLEYYGQLNLLKGGIVYADAVNTVSPAYAREIQTPEYGLGLDGVLRHHRGKLSGILNGIDEEEWDPQADAHIAERFSSQQLAGKKTCKKLLQRELGLPMRAGTFLLGVISRLDRQKGIELICDAFPQLATLDIQLAVLGSGDRALQERLQHLHGEYPAQVALRLGYDEPLAHRIIAGVDAFLVPSRYEPCGLTQMYSQRYGTVPIVRATGGLADTVANYTPRRLAEGKASGFSFSAFDAGKLAEAVKRAARLYFADRKSWGKLMRHIMAISHSWDGSARKYEALYRKLAGSRGQHMGASHG
jgi:starch synthase